MTLRQVEEITLISNAYLSQLETGKIKKPSAQALYSLAKVYGVNVETLLIESGLVKQQDITPIVLIPSLEERITILEKKVAGLEFINTKF